MRIWERTALIVLIIWALIGMGADCAVWHWSDDWFWNERGILEQLFRMLG